MNNDQIRKQYSEDRTEKSVRRSIRHIPEKPSVTLSEVVYYYVFSLVLKRRLTRDQDINI